MRNNLIPIDWGCYYTDVMTVSVYLSDIWDTEFKQYIIPAFGLITSIIQPSRSLEAGT